MLPHFFMGRGQQPIGRPRRAQDHFNTCSAFDFLNRCGDILRDDIGGRTTRIGGSDGHDKTIVFDPNTPHHAHFFNGQVGEFRVVNCSDLGPSPLDALFLSHQVALG